MPEVVFGAPVPPSTSQPRPKMGAAEAMLH